MFSVRSEPPMSVRLREISEQATQISILYPGQPEVEL